MKVKNYKEEESKQEKPDKQPQPVLDDLENEKSVDEMVEEKPVKEGLVIIGEVGLTSEVRSVSQIEPRINEARRLGFKQCIIPASDAKELKPSSNMELIGVNNLREAVQYALTNN